MIQPASLLIFGEVLFDHFPDGQRRLGGAPFNVAWHLQAMGFAPLFISRIGDDPQAHEIYNAMEHWQMNCAGLQYDTIHPTGKVEVILKSGEPNYDIVRDCAYDFIDVHLIPPMLAEGLLYHGSLALRNPVSRAALEYIKDKFNGTIFMDVNLRTPWWDKQTLLQDMHNANWVKLNHQELKLLGLAHADLKIAATNCMEQFNLDGIIITMGENGALGMTRNREPYYVTPTPAINIVDSVGAGDAFTSVMVAGLLSDWSLPYTMERAQLLASAVVGIRGALPDSREFYQTII